MLEGDDVVGDFGWVDFESELDVVFGEGVEDWCPLGCEVLVSLVDVLVGGWGEEVEFVPDRGAGEAVDDGDSEFAGGVGGVDHVLGGASLDAGWVAVSPDVIGED